MIYLLRKYSHSTAIDKEFLSGWPCYEYILNNFLAHCCTASIFVGFRTSILIACEYAKIMKPFLIDTILLLLLSNVFSNVYRAKSFFKRIDSYFMINMLVKMAKIQKGVNLLHKL